MPGSKYEREIRFIGKEVVRLTGMIEDIRNGKGSGNPEKDAADIAEMEAKIAEYRARRKEIEDSYIAMPASTGTVPLSNLPTTTTGWA